MTELSLSPLDLAVIKIKRLEREAERYEVRLSALRCRVTELLKERPTITIVKGEINEQ